MATDIAFAVAVVTAVGKRISSGARLFLLSLAVVDDLGAIIVIAMFYTAGLSLFWLVGAMGTVVAAFFLQRLDVRSLLPYVLLAALCWLTLLESGVNATIAGVAFGFLVPIRSFYDPRRLPERIREMVAGVDSGVGDGASTRYGHDDLQIVLRDIHQLSLEGEAPLERLQNSMGPWVSFLGAMIRTCGLVLGEVT